MGTASVSPCQNSVTMLDMGVSDDCGGACPRTDPVVLTGHQCEQFYQLPTPDEADIKEENVSTWGSGECPSRSSSTYGAIGTQSHKRFFAPKHVHVS
jgi:hypothetical protein